MTSAHLIYGSGIGGNDASQQLSFFQAERIDGGSVANWDQQLDANTISQLQLK